MIRYTLKCDQGHGFESWFQSSDAFDGLMKRAMVECPECASSKVTKSLMAPKVQGTKKKPKAIPPGPAANPVAKVDQNRETAIAELRKHVEENSEYVGMNFATEARAIHSGDAPERAIFGEAKLPEAKALIEEGVPVAPLPFAPKRKMN